ncbi:alternative ribosome rescue aminoacyl-tRNA hydrolase ArfB [Sphingobacterium chuzhouense]|uniref:Aminoacyl-tRNA hydrolase n=1 Tax=Sphingobacterium chuzhouense TaxID=1742264 RepID=A0ABR7XWS9_9SPHI|nr:alternative ribosome rescue aminoacyl-tRNA hydrolase ArfB [Sphingobacterium chuzhouense]MBD1423505.1 aminoacyl-tRNA hydrolase [Sphingobacterium chuzhouense]
MNNELLQKELAYKTSRSGGAGGQHVNKVESKVTLIWNVNESESMTEDEKIRVRQKLANRLNKDGLLQMEASTERSQVKNKEIVTARFFDLLYQALKKEKKRVATKIPKSQILDRLDRKKKQSQKKQNRRKKFNFD